MIARSHVMLQGYAAPGQPYPYMQQPYPGQPMMGQQPGYAPPAWGSGPMQGPLQPGYPMQADPDQPQPAQGIDPNLACWVLSGDSAFEKDMKQ